jgi:hypothetical protein
MLFVKWAAMRQMKKSIKISILLFLIWALAIPASAQISGTVVDEGGVYIPYASLQYKGHGVVTTADGSGHYRIARHDGWMLTVSAVGFQTRVINVNANTPNALDIRLKEDNRQLSEVVVKTKRRRYSRKSNPAVEMMQKVIAAKKRTELSNHDYYQYNKYQKITLGINDITPTMMQQGAFAKAKWLVDQVELCEYNHKLILPISVNETVTQKIYRKNPHSEKDIIKGQNSTGVNELFQTGDILNVAMKDVFTDVNINDDEIRLLQYPFCSPIGKNAVAFYRFYIEDTVYVDKDKCYHLEFTPNNAQDFGFRGDIYILADSSWQVKRCVLNIPKKSDVNFVDNIKIIQEFNQLADGQWALTTDDMVAEMKIIEKGQKFVVIRTTRMSDYAFDELPKQLFKGKKKEVRENDAMMRDEAFWKKYRQVELTKSESGMDNFIHHIEQIKGFRYIIFGARALIENFVETGDQKHPSKVDIGPINTMISKNFIDGIRARISAQTTANLDSNWFAAGYYARGFKSKKNYYSGTLTYSFNKKDYLPREFPKRTISFTSSYDVGTPSDKFIPTDKDNVFTAFKWSKVDKMMFYNRQILSFEWEEDWGFKTLLEMKTEQSEAAGDLFFRPLGATDNVKNIRTTEMSIKLRYAPGETFINTKQRRITINLDAPVFTLSHTFGLKNVLGGQYNYNYSEAGIYKRFWMNSWGKIDCYLKAGAQWNKVPFPLLIIPASNLSYIIEEGTFNLVNNMEFLNDRFASVDISWDLNGKIFNRIPLLRKLKWREYIGVKSLWGSLSDKNNPFVSQTDASLFAFPATSFVMDKNRPYVELVAGVHNIFKLFHIEYVRRLNYLNLPTAHRDGIRFMFRVTF